MGEVLDESLTALLRGQLEILIAVLCGFLLALAVVVLFHYKDKDEVFAEIRYLRGRVRYLRGLASAAVSEATALRSENASLRRELGATHPGWPWLEAEGGPAPADYQFIVGRGPDGAGAGVRHRAAIGASATEIDP